MDTQKLIDAGIAYDEAIERFCNNEDLYTKFLVLFCEDPTFGKLKEAMNANDYEQAFFEAHTLKGVAGNLGLKPLFDALVPFVNGLRDKADIQFSIDTFPELEKVYNDSIALIQEQAD